MFVASIVKIRTIDKDVLDSEWTLISCAFRLVCTSRSGIVTFRSPSASSSQRIRVDSSRSTAYSNQHGPYRQCHNPLNLHAQV